MFLGWRGRCGGKSVRRAGTKDAPRRLREEIEARIARLIWLASQLLRALRGLMRDEGLVRLGCIARTDFRKEHRTEPQ